MQLDPFFFRRRRSFPVSIRHKARCVIGSEQLETGGFQPPALCVPWPLASRHETMIPIYAPLTGAFNRARGSAFGAAGCRAFTGCLLFKSVGLP
jgi:hypothetical protein